jgi:DNA-binding Lrp family transcriptional regulator
MRGADVLAALRTIPEVVLCDVLSGDFDLLVRLEARSLERIQDIWEQIAGLPGVHDTVTALTLSTVIRRAPAGQDHSQNHSQDHRQDHSQDAGDRPEES